METEAAVAAIIAPRPQPRVLVLKRSTDPRDPWSGQYSFPGGRREESDRDLLATCIRETREECGLALSPDQMVKQYPVHYAGNRLDRPVPVTTYLFEIDGQPRIRLHRREFFCYEWLDLAYIADRDTLVRMPMSPHHPGLLFPGIPATEGVVWGFTYEMLMVVLTDRYPFIFQDKSQG
ncbi:MAG: NUDIX hydrolase [Desulfobulbus sp.]